MRTMLKEREHIVWVDVLRILACFLVVLAHCCDPFVGQFGNNHNEFISGTLIGSLVRPCVPLFVMISGALLLPVNMEMTTFYSKRAKRLVLPFVFWSLALPVIYYFYVNSGVDIISPNIIVDNYTLEATFKKLYLFLFNFNYDTTPLWYMYMLIGLYLFLPIISAWLKQAKKNDIKIFLKIWVISMLIPYVQMLAPILGYEGNYGNMAILGICDWNAFGMFYYFSGFLGYVVLAYYLKEYPLNWSWSKTLAICSPMFIIGYIITAGGFIMTQENFPGSYAHLEVIWYFYGINVSMMTIAVYIIFQKMQFKPRKWLSKVASLTFGIYLAHFVIVQFAYDIIYPNTVGLPAAIQIILMSILTFALTLLIIWLMSLTKLTRRFVM